MRGVVDLIKTFLGVLGLITIALIGFYIVRVQDPRKYG